MSILLTEYYPLISSHSNINEAMEKNDQGRMVIKKVLLQRANAKNRNGRIYPRAILEREITKYNENMVKTRRALGELDHSNEAVVNLKNVSHLITEMWWEGDEVYGNVEVLDGDEFPSGRIMAGLLKRKIPVGISSRGMGSVKQTNEAIEVQEDFALLCFDSVSFESTQGSNMSLQEGFDGQPIIQEHKIDTIDGIIHDLICNNSGVCSCMFK